MGTVGALEDPATLRRVRQMPCYACHGRDGGGGAEGGAPAIDALALGRATAQRPAYAAEAFRRALAEGRDPAGRALARLMPRYAFSRTEAAALLGWLDRVRAEQRKGVLPDRLRIAVAMPAGEPGLGVAMLAALQAGMDSRGGAGPIWARRVDFVPHDPASEPPGDVLAVVGALAADVPGLAAQGVPVLFPLGPLEGDEDPGLVRGAGASRLAMRAALTRAMAARGVAQVTILAGPGAAQQADAAALARQLRLEVPGLADAVAVRRASDLATGQTGDLVVLTAEGAARAKGWPGRVWLPWHLAAGGQAAEVMAIIDAPWLLDRAMERGQHPVLVHAERAGAVLAAALRVAGRDVTRSRLLAALRAADLADLGLDYAAQPLTGSAEVHVVALPQGPEAP